MKSRFLASAGRIVRFAALLMSIAFGSALAQRNPPAPPPPVPVPPIQLDTLGLPYIEGIVVGQAACTTCPPQVCLGDPVHVSVFGHLPPCVQFRGLHEEPSFGLFPVVVAEFVVDTCRAACPDLIAPFVGGTSLPPQPGGPHAVTVRVNVRSCPDTLAVVDSSRVSVNYDVRTDCAPPPIPPDSLVRTFVRLAITPEHPCAGDAVKLWLLTNGCPPCVNLKSFGTVDPDTGSFAGVFEWTPNCLNIRCAPESLSTSMGQFAQGSYHVIAPMTVHVLGTANPDSVITFVLPLAFQVGPPGCGGPPPPIPPDSLVRTFVRLAITPEHPCAGDSVTLQLIKNGCPPCVHLRSFGMDPGACPTCGGLQGVIDWTPVCNERLCVNEMLSTPMGRLAAGSFTVAARMVVVVHRAPDPDTTITFRLPFQFDVSRDCPSPPGPCVVREMESNVPSASCALILSPGAAGDVPLFYSSGLPMAGVQGVIEVPPRFQLTDLRVASELSGVHVDRWRGPTGFRWVVFTDPGVTLPTGPHQHLLDATIAADPSAPNGTSAFMPVTITLAAGADADSLPLCNRETLMIVAVRLCVAGEPTLCDINGDGRLDVRDLVRMTTCLDSLPHPLRDESPCRDCNRDSTFDISDIFCCADHILRGPLVPRDSVVSDGRVQVSFDPPEPSGAGWYVRVHVRGANALGAALLRFEYPGDRWRVEQVLLRDPPWPVDADWYSLADLDEPGRAHLGGLRIGQTGSGDDLVFRLLITPTGTPQPSDRFTAVGADLAARSGAVLTPTSALPSLSLDGTAPPISSKVSLSSPRPNPFATSTQFVVTLPSTSRVDLAVHDLAGRRVATLASGTYAPGEHPFTWDGAGAHDGVYFVRLTVNGQVLSSRVAMLRDSR